MIVPLLEACLQPVADRDRRLRLWSRLAVCWATLAVAGLGLVVFQRQSGWASALALPAVATLGLAAAILAAVRHGRTPPDWRRVARQVEGFYPELEGRLVTAVQQETGPAGALSYLQERLVHEAALHSTRTDWARAIPKSRVRIACLAHLLTLGLFGMVLWELGATGGHRLLVRIPDSTITVTPGDASVERGNNLVVLARFGGRLPATVDLVVGDSAETTRRIPLVKSLADPMFGGSLPEVTSNLTYHLEYAGRRTRDYEVTVFEHPRLERADADLSFPDYTGQADRHIKDARRLSAVEGSRLDLALQFNKPVVSARLVAKDDEKDTVSLLVGTNRAVAELKRFPLEASKTYELRLLDAENRTNKASAQFVFEVLKNRVPELRLASPRGDLRPSSLEEISFAGTVWDDFGVLAYGLAYTLVGQEPRYVELGRGVPAQEKRSFQYLLALEDLGLQADQLISWFVWADDVGPDGQARRTPGDLFFAEVRPFDEIFRQGQGMDSQAQQERSGNPPGSAGNQTERLAELQKQIISATWRLQRDRGNASKPGPGQGSAPANGAKPARDAAPTPRRSTAVRPSAESAGAFLDGGRREDPSAGVWPSSGVMGAIGGESAIGDALPPVMGQRAEPESAAAPPGTVRTGRGRSPASVQPSKFEDDAAVVRDSQAQALEQAQAARERQQDPRTATLWEVATKEMDKALARLKDATLSPAELSAALAAEQAAYQALLKLQQHEFEVSRSRNRNSPGGGRGQQMQRQLDQLDLTRSENRYETQRQAQPPPSAERREQLQVMNRLQELARRQQDLNDRLRELQTALQEARTEQERQDVQRRLQRLQEEEQQMLADVDELQQRMDRPENQSRMTDERRQLDQTRSDVQRAAEAAGQGAASQALASGTRAQRQLQELRDQMRKENSSQFADDLREMRAQARELAQQQEDVLKKMQDETANDHKTLTVSEDRQALLNQLARQKERMTNLLDRATEVSQQAEGGEPLLSRQLYDTLRKFGQDSAENVKDVQDELLNRGLMTRSLYERLRATSDPDGAKLLDVTSELLRQDFLPQANETGQRVRSSLEDLKRGVERAAESVLGDDTEALRLARQELDQLTGQLQREIARAEAESAPTNQPERPPAGANAGQRAGNLSSNNNNRLPAGQDPDRPSRQTAQAGDQNPPSADRANAGDNTATPGGQPRPAGEEAASAQGVPRAGGGPAQDGNGRDSRSLETPDRRGGPGQAARTGPERRTLRDAAPRGTSAAVSGGNGGDSGVSRDLDLDRILTENAAPAPGPITGEDFVPWTDRLRDVEEMMDRPDLRNEVAVARERARLLRQEFKRDQKKPDWAVVRLQVIKPLVEVRDRITEELARRESTDALVPIDRDPVPYRYSELVRRYYEELGKDK